MARHPQLKLTRSITPDEVAAYRNVGVVHLRGILDLATVNCIRRGIDESVRSIRASKSGYNLSELTTAFLANDAEALARASDGQHDVSGIVQYMRSSGDPLLFDEVEGREGRFLLDTGVASRITALRQACLSGGVPEIPAVLLRSSAVRYYGDQIFVKEPGTRERTAFHQDATYFEIDGDQCCVLWIPVDPAGAETSGMQYVRGSHRNGKLYRPNVFVSQTPLPGAEGEPIPDIDGHPDDYDVISFEAEPGDVLVHHFKTVHGSGGNRSRYQVRRAISIRYCGDDIRTVRRPWAPAQLHHTQKLPYGEPLEGPDFPIVWKRCSGQDAA